MLKDLMGRHFRNCFKSISAAERSRSHYRSQCIVVVLVVAVHGGVRAQTVEYVHTDALGSPILVTDANRNVVERSEYEPYGQLVNRPNKDGPGYAGQVSDAQTGLSYMQQRYYDPLIGRFLSVDPVEADVKTGANFNRYKYAANNPYVYIDPDGREPNRAQAGNVLSFVFHMNNSPSKVGLQTGAKADMALQSMATTKGFPPSPTVTPYFNTKNGRYIYTKKAGWIDMVHFLFYAGKARGFEANGSQNPVGEAVQDGYQQELFDPSRSRYSYEDLPSDRFGAKFGSEYFDPESDLTLGQQIGRYLYRELEATTPDNAPNYDQMPKTDSGEPPTMTNGTTTPVDLENRGRRN